MNKSNYVGRVRPQP